MKPRKRTKGTLMPDRQQAEEYLNRLDPDATYFTFQTFDDREGKKKNPALSRVLTGTLGEHWDTLVELNLRGAGIFVTVNETDGKGRKKDNIVRIRAVWQEADHGDEPALPIEPHLVIESSPGKSHSYILTDTDQVDEFEPVQQRLVDDHGSDPNAKDRSRVLRLAGFYHQKGEPHLVRISALSKRPSLTWEKVKAIFPPVIRTPKQATVGHGDINLDEAKDALTSLDPDMQRSNWIKVGMSLHSTGHPEAFNLWNNWSSRGKKYHGDEMEKKWNSFSQRDDQVNIATLLFMARKNGWQGYIVDEAQALLERYVYLGEADRFYDTQTGAIYTTSGFNNFHRQLNLGRTPANWLTSNPVAQKASALVYWPGKPSGSVGFRGKNCWNTYRGADIELIPDVTDKMVLPYLDHVEYIIPDTKEREHLLNILAHTVQRPDTKINQAILLGGKPRIGKDTLFQPLIHALGTHNVSQPGAHELQSTFNGFLAHSKVVIFQEIQNFEKTEIENKLKPMLAAPPDTLRVNEKYMAPYEIPNVGFCIFMSNHRNALKISAGDGRYFAIWSNAEKRPDEYYTELYDWLEQGNGNNLVASWLMQRDLFAFQPKSPAMETKYKQELIEIGRTDLEFSIQNLIDEAEHGTYKPVMQFQEILSELGPDPYNKLSNKAVRNALVECGAKHCKPRRSTGARERVSLWILANTEHYAAMTPKQLIQAYDKLQDPEFCKPQPKCAPKVVAIRSKG